MRRVERANVPCGLCRLCCKSQVVLLLPERGDDISQYDYTTVVNPVTGKDQFMLRHLPNGDCVYLSGSGCSIHARAPFMCQEFDCRRQFLGLPRNLRRVGVKNGHLSKAILDAGRERLGSLNASLPSPLFAPAWQDPALLRTDGPPRRHDSSEGASRGERVADDPGGGPRGDRTDPGAGVGGCGPGA